LIDVARFHLAGRSLVRRPTLPTVAPLRIGLVEEGAAGWNVVQQALRHKLVFERLQVLTPGHAFGDGVEPAPGRRDHQLEILNILTCGARGDFIDPFASVARIGAAEFHEGVEEMVVRGDACRRHEAAHREGIDKIVVQALVLGKLGRRNLVLLAHGLKLCAGDHRLRLGKGLGVLIHAEPVGNRIANMRLGIDGAAQMAVQVCAFRHALEEVAKRERL
jgi:hypothetical protein